jgi:hypothetical protein
LATRAKDAITAVPVIVIFAVTGKSDRVETLVSWTCNGLAGKTIPELVEIGTAAVPKSYVPYLSGGTRDAP